jgi:hypothetical protein
LAFEKRGTAMVATYAYVNPVSRFFSAGSSRGIFTTQMLRRRGHHRRLGRADYFQDKDAKTTRDEK